MGPHQPILLEYPQKKLGNQNRHFQSNWFQKFPRIEYSPSKDAVFCFPCFLFENKSAKFAAFTIDGFNSWKRINDGKRCSLLLHVGGKNSQHNNNVKAIDVLMNVTKHIDKVINVHDIEDMQKNRLRLKATVESVRWLSLQACALRGHDESTSSRNQGNFIEMLRLLGRMNGDIDNLILEKAPQNAKYTPPQIQKNVLHVLATKVRNEIHKDNGDAKFCILVDEAKDVANKEQMSIILKFVDVSGYVQERFFDIVHVADTTAATLKKETSNVLGRYKLHICNMRGQGYDGASNMRGSWNGLPALVFRDCPSAYYVHCFAHRLLLALVATAEKEVSVWLFFSKLNSIVNIFSVFPKCLAELNDAQAVEIAHMVAIGERDNGRGANQICSLQRAGKTRWSSHFESICSVVDLFSPLMTVLKNIVDGGSSNIIKRLQQKYLDILNAMDYVSATKASLHDLREEGYDCLYWEVVAVCSKYDIEVPNMDSCYKSSTVKEINNRFNDDSVELLKLSASLNPRDGFKLFDIDRIYTLADKFYPDDFFTTATTERAFSAMKIVKTVLRNKMEEGYLADNIVVYIERELSENMDVDSIIDEFYCAKNCRAPLQ